MHNSKRLSLFTRLSIFFLLSALPVSSLTKSITLTFKSDDTSYTITFDDAKISEAQVRTLIPLSPYVSNYAYYPNMENFSTAQSSEPRAIDKFLTALPLELCPEDQPAYTDCSNNAPLSQNFFRNASVNLEKSHKGLAWLQSLPHPKELQSVIDYLVKNLSASVAVEDAKFRYYSTWDISVLKQATGALGASSACSAAFQKIDAATTHEEKYKAVWHDWHNCVLTAARTPNEIYPLKAWHSFLKAFDIQEKYYEEGPPD
jgi:hypothetical protein